MKHGTIPLSKIGVKPGETVEGINLDIALSRYVATHSVDLGDAPKAPVPVDKSLTMREHILMLSLSPDPLQLSKIKRVFR
jgi:hypothetical protein